MTQEDKELLLKDLSARLPYGVICKCYHMEFDEWDGKPFTAIYNEILNNIDANGSFLAGGFSYDVDEIKPYLRPMSSMTEEESKEYRMFIDYSYNDFTSKSTPCVYVDKINDYLDWLNAHHFDYRGLIEKGLALEALEGMYN